jgi:hypothetical protein
MFNSISPSPCGVINFLLDFANYLLLLLFLFLDFITNIILFFIIYINILLFVFQTP